MFGARFFGNHFFGHRYWGHGSVFGTGTGFFKRRLGIGISMHGN